MVDYRNIEWKESPAHVRFLGRFKNPRSRKRESQNDYLTHELKEEIDQAIQRFIDNGMLVEPTLAQAISSIHNKPPIEDMLRKHDLKVSGSKSQIIDRLIENAPEAAKSMIGNHDLLICSSGTTEFLENYEQLRQQNEKEAKKKSYKALFNGNGKLAFKTYVQFEKQFGNGNSASSYNYYGEQMDIILEHTPQLLAAFDERNQKYLRAATCMPLIWRDEVVTKWLPKDFATPYEDAEVACNLLSRYAEIQSRIGDADENDKFKITFDTYDVESCELCRKLDDQVITFKEMPELPYKNCTSRKGCHCHIRHHWEGRYTDDEYEFDDDDGEPSSGITFSIDYGEILDFNSLDEIIAEHIEKYVKEHVEIKLDPYSRLKQLKQMLDNNLISEDEYDKTKKRILENM